MASMRKGWSARTRCSAPPARSAESPQGASALRALSPGVWDADLNRKRAIMKCVICKQGETYQGIATVTLERAATTLVFSKCQRWFMKLAMRNT
jgi:hypothetical protein